MYICTIQLTKKETDRKELNPKKEPLTIPVLKRLTKKENMSDEEAEELLLAIKTLASILVEIDNEDLGNVIQLYEPKREEHELRKTKIS